MPATTVRSIREPVRARPARGLRHIWAGTLATLLGLLFIAVTVMTLALWAADPASAETGPVVDLGFFALGMMTAAGFASQIRHRGGAGLYQAILALLALAAAGLLGGRIEPLAGALVLLAAATPLGLSTPRRPPDRGRRRSTPLAALSAAASVPAIGYAAALLAEARAAGPSCFLGQCAHGDRLAEAAAFAVALVLLGALASLRTPGWPLPAWSAGLGALLLASTSLLFPGEAGALTAGWAVATGLWGAAFIAIALRQAQAGR
jgi:hypothetical protein